MVKFNVERVGFFPNTSLAHYDDFCPSILYWKSLVLLHEFIYILVSNDAPFLHFIFQLIYLKLKETVNAELRKNDKIKLQVCHNFENYMPF